MYEQYSFDSIDSATFDSLLRKYPKVVPEKLADLEEQRLQVILDAVRSREPTYLTKDELATLMDWKLAHGTFRPSLQKLIQQNDESTVRELTESHLNGVHAREPDEVAHAIKGLSALRGVGPATASLILSTASSDDVPFFSDELYTWAFWDERPSNTQSSTAVKAGHGGWKLKYSDKEYKALCTRISKLRERLNKGQNKRITALDVEKVAYVLGNSADDSGDASVSQVAKGKKRKAAEENKSEGARPLRFNTRPKSTTRSKAAESSNSKAPPRSSRHPPGG